MIALFLFPGELGISCHFIPVRELNDREPPAPDHYYLQHIGGDQAPQPQVELLYEVVLQAGRDHPLNKYVDHYRLVLQPQSLNGALQTRLTAVKQFVDDNQLLH